jgi:RNA polymerase sigma-70 factor (ECF subfamily)
MSVDSRPPQDEFALRFIENQGRVYGYIATLLPNRVDAEDVLQRTSLIMWQKWGQYEPSHGFLPWARGIALNEVRNFLRHSDRKNVYLSETMIEVLADELEGQELEPRSEALTYCMDRLRLAQRNLLEQCYLGAAGIDAVATSIGSTPAAVYMRLHRIRKSLIECIERRISNEINA